MSESTVIVLGSLGIFAFMTVTLVALVFDRAISVKANKDEIAVTTNEDPPDARIAERPMVGDRE